MAPTLPLSPADSAALDARLAGMSDDELRAKMAELRRFMAAVKSGKAKSFLQETFGICGQTPSPRIKSLRP